MPTALRGKVYVLRNDTSNLTLNYVGVIMKNGAEVVEFVVKRLANVAREAFSGVSCIDSHLFFGCFFFKFSYALKS